MPYYLTRGQWDLQQWTDEEGIAEKDGKCRNWVHFLTSAPGVRIIPKNEGHPLCGLTKHPCIAAKIVGDFQWCTTDGWSERLQKRKHVSGRPFGDKCTRWAPWRKNPHKMIRAKERWSVVMMSKIKLCLEREGVHYPLRSSVLFKLIWTSPKANWKSP